MEHCETCKYWTPTGHLDYELAGIGVCSAAVNVKTAIDFDSADPSRPALRPEYRGSLLFIEDSGKYYADLKTMFNFGCAIHRWRFE